MTEQEPKQTGFDNSWAAWKDRLGIGAVLLALVMLLLFMFTDASINYQCSVTDFVMMKCNRFDRKFVPWDELEKQRGKSSLLRIDRAGGRSVAFRFKAYGRA